MYVHNEELRVQTLSKAEKLSSVVLARQHKWLAERRALIQPLDSLSSEEVLKHVRETSASLCRIALHQQFDNSQQPLIQHALRVANQGQTLFSVCCPQVAFVLAYGKDLGLTAEKLRDDYQLPEALIQQAQYMLRNEDESDEDYFYRLIEQDQYTAFKLKLIQYSDLANPMNYQFGLLSNTDIADIQRQQKNATELINTSYYQEHSRFELVNGIIDMSKLAMMVYNDEYSRDDDERISLCMYFGYEGIYDRFATLFFEADLTGDDGVTLKISTFSNRQTWSTGGTYATRRQIVKFDHVQEVYDYIDQVHVRLGTADTIVQRRDLKNLSHLSLGKLVVEKFAIEELDNMY